MIFLKGLLHFELLKYNESIFVERKTVACCLLLKKRPMDRTPLLKGAVSFAFRSGVCGIHRPKSAYLNMGSPAPTARSSLAIGDNPRFSHDGPRQTVIAVPARQ